jgi:Pyruvate/2-oxoacid:ferredoxin oxidoreductase delta subunit
MSPPTLHVHYLSGTGNTRRCAAWIAEEAAQAGHPVELAPLEAGPPSALGPLVVALPTHGFTAPWAVIKWAAQLPRTQGVPAWVLCTRAGVTWFGKHPPGASCSAPFVTSALLAARGYRPRGALTVNMPSNWMSAHPPQSVQNTQAVISNSEPLVRDFARTILGGGRRWLTANLLYEAINGLFLAPVSMLYLCFGRVFLGKLFMSNHRCDGCALCAKSCPVGALQMRGGRPFWTWSCESCMRCMAFCPKGAIDASQGWGLALTLVTALPLLLLLLPTLLSTTARITLAILAFIAWNYVAVILGYAIFARLIQRPGWNRLAWWGALWRGFRRYREPDTRLAQLRRPESLEP